MATDVHDNEVDERPLSEKLVDHIQPEIRFNHGTNDLNVSSGAGFQITGNAHDIERVRTACKQAMKRIEENKFDLAGEFTVVVPPRDTH